MDTGVLYVLLSFDDTNHLNTKCADILNKYNLRGTFYLDVIRISDQLVDDIKKISENHEIGSQGITHRDLTRLPPEDLMYECKKSKEILGSLIGKPVNSFAYPYGYFSNNVKKAVINSGYMNARSFTLGNTSIDNDKFALRVTMGATSYGYRQIPFSSAHLKSMNFYIILG